MRSRIRPALDGTLRAVGDSLLPIVTLAVMLVGIFVLGWLGDTPLSWQNGANVMSNFGLLGALALAIALSMLIGEFDLSVTSMFLVGATVAVLTGASSPVIGVLLAVGVGVVAGTVQGGLVAKLRISSVPITLGGYLILLGLAFTLTKNESVSYPRFDVGLRLDQPVLEIFSIHSLLIIALFLIAAVVLGVTRVGSEVRGVGGDRRASRVAGVRVDRIVIAIFIASGVLAAFSGALQGYALAAVSPNIALTPLVFAVSAAVLGGIRLEGGRGTVLGVAMGVISLSILQEGLVLISASDQLRQIVTGGLLMLVALVSAPDIARHLRRLSTSSDAEFGDEHSNPLNPGAAVAEKP